MNDLDYSIDEINDTLNEKYNRLSAITLSDYKTKQTLRQEIIELERIRVIKGYVKIERQEFASYMSHQFSKYDSKFHADGDFYSLFDDEEKDSKKRPMSGDSRETISSPLPINKQSGIQEIDELKKIENNLILWPNNNRYCEYIDLIRELDTERFKQGKSIKDKYGHALAYADAFKKVFPDVIDYHNEVKRCIGNTKKEWENRYEVYQEALDTIALIQKGLDVNMDEIKERISEAKFTSKLLDERNKITFIQKWNGIACNLIDQTKSYVAKLLKVDKKHMTNNINPTNNPVTGAKNLHHDQISYFKCMKWVCPCGRENIADVKNYFDEQIERGKLNIPFKPLILTNCEVKE